MKFLHFFFLLLAITCIFLCSSQVDGGRSLLQKDDRKVSTAVQNTTHPAGNVVSDQKTKPTDLDDDKDGDKEAPGDDGEAEDGANGDDGEAEDGAACDDDGDDEDDRSGNHRGKVVDGGDQDEGNSDEDGGDGEDDFGGGDDGEEENGDDDAGGEGVEVKKGGVRRNGN